jgi:hypothetical protein
MTQDVIQSTAFFTASHAFAIVPTKVFQMALKKSAIMSVKPGTSMSDHALFAPSLSKTVKLTQYPSTTALIGSTDSTTLAL